MEMILFGVVFWTLLCGLSYLMASKLASYYIQNTSLWWAAILITVIPWIPLDYISKEHTIPSVLLNTNLQQLAEPLFMMTKQTQVTSDWLDFALTVLILVYGAGLTAQLSVFIKQYWRVRQLCSTASKVSFGYLTCYQLPVSCSPFVFGVLKPKIYLPAQFNGLPKSEQEALIFHELTHINKGDHIAVMVWRVLASIAWFNPFIVKMEQGFVRAMEYRCDEATITAHRLEPLVYSKALMNSLKRAATQTDTVNMTVSFASNSLTLEDYKKRFTVILKSHKKPSNAILFGLCMLFTSGLGYANLQWTAGTTIISKAWAYPVVNPEITSKFGHISNFRHNKAHQGLDLGGNIGEPAMAVASGTVIIADDKTLPKNYGKVVLISHGNGYQSLYAHLDSVNVVAGEKVSQGEVIGTIGETGRVTGPHLHLEALHNNTRIDPLSLLDN
ncbi:M23/M56 family metallopeptidase [Pseudoalteromonas piscicida]|uniref:Peptidase M23 n=1 Tax=Pseudoalteromonas piscicida TaxID=43662 RepID=A0A2A5JSY4_PSEO7|nr:M23/M56 family metallopeptidase [Pseudoalteromonas piscicida]PCK32449.1 peptidase M23 [Pseudoalteromonas piscicida]